MFVTSFALGPCKHQIRYLTNRFHVAVRLFSNRSQMTSKCGKNKKVRTDVATWNLFVLYNKELNFIRIKADGDVNRASVL